MEISQLFKDGSYSSLLSFLIDNVSDVIIITDNNLIIKSWNRAAEKIYGWTEKEIIGKKINEISNMEFLNGSIEDFRKELFEKKKWHGEFKQKVKGGNEIHFFSSWSLIENNQGNTNEVLIIICDITKKKNFVQKSEDFNEIYKLILDNAYDLITIIDKDLKHEYINEKVYFDQLGYKKEEIIGKTPLEPLHPDDIKEASKALREGLKKGSGIFELRLKKKNGPYIWLECKGKTFIDKNGEKKALIISRDINERKKMELKLKESEEKFRTISEQLFMGIIIFQNNEIVYVNEAAADIFEYSIEEILKWSREDMTKKCIHPDDLPYIRELDQVWKKEVFDLNPNISFRIITKLGKIKWIEQYPKIFQYKGSEAQMISFLDITDKKEAESLITEENKKLIELDKLKDDLIVRMSHELKTPLTTMYLASQMLLTSNKYKLDDEILKYIQIINRGNIRLKSIMENLLDISKIDSNKFELKLQENNINEIIKECIYDIEYLAKNRKIELNYELQDKIFLIVDKIRIEQVIINLISNAIKNTPIGGKIYIKTDVNSEFIDIQIKDTGVGLTSKEKERLFQKFGKIERPGMGLEVDFEGTGLGLYISKHIVESHGGKIFVESEGINKGSTFTVRLFKK